MRIKRALQTMIVMLWYMLPEPHPNGSEAYFRLWSKGRKIFFQWYDDRAIPYSDTVAMMREMIQRDAPHGIRGE